MKHGGDPHAEATQAQPLEELSARAARLEPALKRRIWPPLTNMLIPSVLHDADELLRDLDAAVAAGAPGAVELREHIRSLRRDFRRGR